MLIGLRNRKTNRLVFKDMLDIDFDMSVEEKDTRFYVRIDRSYRLAEEFLTHDEAEDRMCAIAASRNQLEQELRDY